MSEVPATTPLLPPPAAEPAAQAQQQPARQLTVVLEGDGPFSRHQVEGLLESIDDMLGAGFQMRWLGEGVKNSHSWQS